MLWSHYYLFRYAMLSGLNKVLLGLQFKYDGVHMELQGSRLGFNISVAPSSVKLGVLEFMEVGVGSKLDWSWIE